MEKYYVPLNIYSEMGNDFAVQWNGFNYRVFSVCPSEVPESVEFTEIHPWGHIVGIGESVISTSTPNLLIGDDCEYEDNLLPVVQSSRSIFDAPNFSPFEPFYFVLCLIFVVCVFLFSLRLLFGKTYR